MTLSFIEDAFVCFVTSKDLVTKALATNRARHQQRSGW